SGGLTEAQLEVIHRNDTNKALAYRRHGASGQEVLVVLNFKNKTYGEYDIGVDDPGPWTIRVDTDSSAYGPDLTGGQPGAVMARPGTKDGKSYTLPLRLGAYAGVVLTR